MAQRRVTIRLFTLREFCARRTKLRKCKQERVQEYARTVIQTRSKRYTTKGRTARGRIVGCKSVFISLSRSILNPVSLDGSPCVVESSLKSSNETYSKPQRIGDEETWFEGKIISRRISFRLPSRGRYSMVPGVVAFSRPPQLTRRLEKIPELMLSHKSDRWTIVTCTTRMCGHTAPYHQTNFPPGGSNFLKHQMQEPTCIS